MKLKDACKIIIHKIKCGIFYRKIIEIFILIKEFFIAFIDIFWHKKDDGTYISLAPTSKADEDGTYCNALKYAINNSEIKNIAITGNYGSGKSSVLKTFFEKLENKKYNPIYVSLAAFNKDDYIKYKNEGEDNIQLQNEFYHTLEKSILQQLLYQASGKEVPLSRFKRLSKHSKFFLNLMTIGIISSICIIIMICFPKVIDSGIDNYNTVIGKIHKTIINILLTIMIFVVYIIIYKVIFFLTTKFNVSKFKIKDAEVEIDSKPESIFNRYLDEIIYFFQVTKHDIVIIEDLDRYEGNASIIFQKLRELNTLINSSMQVKYEVDFIYAIKDDFFKNYEERTKFFDYIIPIIPISSNGNSNEIIWNRLEELKLKGNIKYKFDKEFIDDIAIILEDKRLIDNIINEFIIYTNKMQDEHLDDRQMFSIIAYKNIFPENYALLQKNTGTICDVFKKKKNKIRERIEILESNRNALINKKEAVNKEFLNNIKELKYVLIADIYEYNSYPNYLRVFKLDNKELNITEFLNDDVDYNKICDATLRFQTKPNNYIDKDETEIFGFFGNKAIFLERWKNLEDGKEETLKEIQMEIEKIDMEMNNVGKLTLKQLGKTYDIKDIYEGTFVEERFLLERGYITEDYKDYITLFIPGNLTKQDKAFYNAVKTGEVLNYDFKLTNIDNILKKLNENDFENKAVLNYDLLQHLLISEQMDKVLKIIQILDEQDESILGFVDGFINIYNNDNFIEILLNNSNTIWKKIYTKLGNNEYLNIWCIRFLENVDALENIDDNFKNYVKQSTDIDKYIKSNKIDDILESMVKLNIKFENIDKIRNKSFFEKIYQRNLYKLNSNMIKLILEFNGVKTERFNNQNLKLIFTVDKLKEYVLENFEEYYNYCYSFNDSDEDDLDTLNVILDNEDIDIEIKKEIIKNEKFNTYNIENLELELSEEIIKSDKMNNNYENLLYYFTKINKKIDDNIILNIKLHIDLYKVGNLDKYVEKFDIDTINDFKLKYIFDNRVGIEEFKILSKSFNVRIVQFANCDNERIEYLVDENILVFNPKNFEYIKENVNSKSITFIIKNIDDFLDCIGECDITEYQDDLFLSNEVTVESKKKIVDNIILEELKNSTLLYLINAEIIYTDNKNLIKKIIKDNNITIENKLKLLILTIKQSYLTKEEITECIHSMGGKYQYINIFRNACNIDFNNGNMELCKMLKENDYISSYKKGKKNNIILYNKGSRQKQ